MVIRKMLVRVISFMIPIIMEAVCMAARNHYRAKRRYKNLPYKRHELD